MKSRMLLHLRRCNQQLKRDAWFNYQIFLDTLLSSTSHPASADLLSLLKAGDFTGLVEKADSLSSTVYSTPAEHRLVNQLVAMVRKYPFPSKSVSFDPRKKALRTFLSSEHKCLLMNRKFKLFDTLRSPHEMPLSNARHFIKYVLGDLKIADVYEHCNFGAGASVGVHGNATNMARKLLANRWSVSPSAHLYARAAMSGDAHIFELLTRREGSAFHCLDIDSFNTEFDKRALHTVYNKISFVPKTVKTERTIAVEPLLNGFLQKGIDVVMRKRLLRIGVDLRNQGVNQAKARLGSMPGDDPFVTIDLSSASDSISIGLCRNLLPPDWFEFLDRIRSRGFLLDGKQFAYQKFTTMGNGFCFPLETLIFVSLCNVAYSESKLETDYTVYGDDIIVRQSVAGRVLELLKICGFKANLDKTFLNGPFRESCGADWFEGVDVRPITLDYAFDSLESIFKFCNLVRSKDWIAPIFNECLKFLEALVPSELMLVRPYSGPVDTALEVPFDVFINSPFARYDRNIQSWSWVELLKGAWADNTLTRLAGYNLALIRGALTGSSSSVPFAVRRKTSTKTRRIPCSHYLSGELPAPNRRL